MIVYIYIYIYCKYLRLLSILGAISIKNFKIQQEKAETRIDRFK